MIEERNGWRIKTRGSAAGLPIAAEYLCQEHGRVTIDVTRDEHGDAPAEQRCPVMVTRSVAGCRLERVTIPCSKASPFVISAPAARVKLVEVVRGGYAKPEHETWTNTENLGEGQDIDEWQDDREKVWERDRENSIKELLNDR
jgi:hypothetical protein